MKALYLSLTPRLISDNAREPGLAGCCVNLRIAKVATHYRQVFRGHVVRPQVGSLMSGRAK